MQLSAITASLGRFLAELQRRKVLRIAAAYVVGAWIVLQVALALQTAMSLSGEFSAAILALLVIGFFVTLVLAWFYEITPEGVKRTAPATGDAPLVKPQTTDLALAGALTLVVIVAVVQLLASSPTAPPATAPATTAEATPPKPEPPALGDKSIAVLPFANLSKKDDDAVFADGLTEEILSVVSQIRHLSVISRTSAFAFKGKDTPLPEIARQLGVRHILEGSVRRDGDDVRVIAQLIDVASDTHLWSETFERNVDNVFGVQEQIARAIANALDVEIALSTSRRGPLAANLEALRSFLEGRERFRLRRTPQDLMESVALYKRAIELDPKFAEAYSALALSYNAIITTFPLRLEEIEPLEQAAAQAAIKLKPSLAQPHAVLAELAKFRLRWETMHDESAKALSLDPSDPLALYVRGGLMVATGHFEEGSRLYDKALKRDPLYVFMLTGAHGAAVARGDDIAASAIARRLARSGTTAAGLGHFALAAEALTRGDRAAAEAHVREAAKVLGGEPSPAVIAAIKSPASLPASIKTIHEELDKNAMLSPIVFVMIGAPKAYLERLILEIDRGNTARVQLFGYAWPAARNEELKATFSKLARKMGLVDYWKKHGWPDRCRAKGEDDFECS